MISTTIRLSTVVGLLFVAMTARAEINPIPGGQSIKPVFDASAVVCSGVVTSTSDVGPSATSGAIADLKRVRAIIEVQDFYKSRDPNERTLVVEFETTVSDRSPSRPSLRKGETVLVFLKTFTPNAYVFADPILGATEFNSVPRRVGEPSLVSLRTALMAISLGSNSDDARRALQLLEGFDALDQESTAKIVALSASRDPEIRFSCLAILLKSRTPGSIERLKQSIDNFSADAEPLALMSAGTELGHITDVQALSAIEALSSSKYLSIRFGAMDAMRLMKSPKSAATLIERLDDPNGAVQYLAVITLAEIFGKYDGDYAPSMYLFDNKPSYYIQLWKLWWAQDGSRVGSLPKGF